jgi:hypothetical protein
MRMLEKLAKRQQHPPFGIPKPVGSPSTGPGRQANSRSS